MKYIEERMIKLGLLRVMIPKNVEDGEAQCPIFISEDWGKKKKGLVLIQGTGDVRAGIWARSVCMNDTLTLGSVIP
jgi:hypothetical protein